MLSILFICSGNTCRSPMAEAVAKHWSKKTFNSNQIQISSAGTHAKPNQATSPEAIIALAKHNISHVGKSQLLTYELIKEQDFIFTMTQEHLNHAQAIIAKNSMSKLPTLMMLHPDLDLQDPLGKGQQPYYELVNEFMTLIPSRLTSFLTP